MSTDTTGRDPEEWMSTAEAAEALGCSQSSVQRKIRAGELQYRRHQGHYRVLRSEVEAPAARRPGATLAVPIHAPVVNTMRDELVDHFCRVNDLSELPPLLKPGQTARGLGVDVRHVRRSAEEGSLPAIKIGARYMVPSIALIDLLCGTVAA